MAMQANLEHKQIIGLLELKQEEHMARIELMEKHAKESDKATFICINIEGSQEAAGRFAEKHQLQTVTHLVGEPPAD